MSRLTVALPSAGPAAAALARDLASRECVETVLLLDPAASDGRDARTRSDGRIRAVRAALASGAGIRSVVQAAPTQFLLALLPGSEVELGQRALERLLAFAEDTGAGLVYSDFRDAAEAGVTERGAAEHPLIDYQPGSIRDGFDFGSLVLLSTAAARAALASGPDAELRWGGLYDLRLRIAERAAVLRLPEPLYTRHALDGRSTGERGFDYVDPRQRDYQLEMEAVATAHLKRIGAFLPPSFLERPSSPGGFPARASVVIPVRNRERTIADAVRSALGQRAGFDFNVIVVDNHSSDGTSPILEELAGRERRLVHLVPERTDLGIGGCWNEAVRSPHCGEYAVQLDSDDLYADERALETMVARFDDGPFAMVIGSYTIVDFGLRPVPPGLIDHREWTRENGRNNALRINGLGAPRAFFVPLLRQLGLPDVSYGEDYAVALRISRHYEIGRVYDPLYLARRWEGNSDAALPLATANRYDAYKDSLRSAEIRARQRLNAGDVPA
jgi:hypothetical protein